MFKNATLYRLGKGFALQAADIEHALQRAKFVACGPTQQESSGWVPPRGEDHGALAEVVAGQIILKLQTETKAVPSKVLAARVEEIADQIEQETGRRPGRKQRKELKEQALLDLLPAAFPRHSAALVWIDRDARIILVDCPSATRSDEVISMLVKALDGLAASHSQTAMSPASAMVGWLGTGEPPAGFTIDRECELRSQDEMKSVVRYSRHALDTDEVRQHIAQGKVPTKLAMTWMDRVSFVLNDEGHLRKLAFLDVVMEARNAKGTPSKDEAFDADVALSTGELGRLLPDLIAALGGDLASDLFAREAS